MIERNATLTAAPGAHGGRTLRWAHRPVRSNARNRVKTCIGCGCASEEVLVTAPQMQPRAESSERLPWGQHHLKANGAGVTLCGQSSLTWHVFWTVKADPLDPSACPVCLEALQHRH